MLAFSSMEVGAAAVCCAMSSIADAPLWRYSFYHVHVAGAGMSPCRVSHCERQLHCLARWAHAAFPQGVFSKWTGHGMGQNTVQPGTAWGTLGGTGQHTVAASPAEAFRYHTLCRGEGDTSGSTKVDTNGSTKVPLKVPGTGMDLEQAEFVMNVSNNDSVFPLLSNPSPPCSVFLPYRTSHRYTHAPSTP
jgi:hypothetical protein